MQLPVDRRLLAPLTTLSLSLGLAMGFTGCAASEKAAFTDHLSATVAAGPAANDDVVIAFADQPDVPATAIASGERQQSRD
jgi:hypothetical protein